VIRRTAGCEAEEGFYGFARKLKGLQHWLRSSATNSCEEASGVDACTVAAPEAITDFAV